MAGGQGVQRGLALPDRCTEVLYHTSVLAGDRHGRWVYPGYLARFSPYLVSYAGCGRDARVPRGDSPNMDRTPRDPRGICNNLGCTRRRMGPCGVGGWFWGIVPLFALLRRRLFGSLGQRRLRRPERVQVAVQRTDVDHTLRHRGRKVDGIACLVAPEFLPPFRNERV